MGALAALLREAGEDVSGSDVAFDPPIGPTLSALGVRCLRGYAAEHVDPHADVVVVGNAIRRENPEATAAEALGLRRASMSATLRDRFLVGRRPLVVTGTHGKTTTSSMCAWVLSRAGFEPGWFIGGLPKGLPGGAAIGSPRLRPGRGRAPFVVEGDEYDSVFWHKEPKFLDYVGVAQNEVVVVTSVEHDHVDIYPSMAAYEDAFRQLLRRMSPDGLVVCDAHDRGARTLVSAEARARVAFYAVDGDDTGDVTPTWLASPAAAFENTTQAFDLFAGGVSCGRSILRVPGRHNVRNALATIAACAEGFGVDVGEARAHLASFLGVARRQDLLGAPGGVRVYDDFAHHPTAVDETLHALRERHPEGALWAVFEPRSATACRSLHQQAYAGAFGAADRVLFAPLGRTAIAEAERLDLALLARTIGPKAEVMPSVDAIVARIVAEGRPGDTVALLSNGSFGGIHGALLEKLKGRIS
jgi:UDP-N-acetylmuramate: L-alanyl-gamma-D-glutamyl-meso-diaminopimelate ligase